MKKKYDQEEILKVKAVYMHARWVYQFDEAKSTTIALTHMKELHPKMPPASIKMYCKDAENIEVALDKKRLDKRGTKKVIKFINMLV